MGLVDLQSRVELQSPPRRGAICRCGHCYTLVDVTDEHRRVRCPGCGRLNSVPKRISATCERCASTQSVRFSLRNQGILCANCGNTMHLHTVELVPRHKRAHRPRSGEKHVSRHDSVVFTIMLYAVVLLFFLYWLSRY